MSSPFGQVYPESKWRQSCPGAISWKPVAHHPKVAGPNPAPATNVLDCRREIDQYVSLALTYVEVRLHYAYAESDRVFA